jgi:pimeloyl-ACP methyl ester carboxylesterase
VDFFEVFRLSEPMSWPRELDVVVGERRIRVRDAGDPEGTPVVFFHGLGDSRLDLRLGEPLAEQLQVRLVSFDRPGYGNSTAAEFGLLSVARDIEAVADQLHVERFAVLGQSAGSRFALAAAVALGERVTCAGCASGSGPVREVGNAMDELDRTDQAAYELLPHDPAAAARVYAAAFEPLARTIAEGDDDDVVAAFEALLSAADLALLADPLIRADAVANARESVRQGVNGMAWDAVSWLASWPFTVRDVTCPVHLWYGSQDTTPLTHAAWLAENLPQAVLRVWPGEGHLAYKRHLDEMWTGLGACHRA